MLCETNKNGHTCSTRVKILIINTDFNAENSMKIKIKM